MSENEQSAEPAINLLWAIDEIIIGRHKFRERLKRLATDKKT
jgi:hypothetical protein